jgi:hypothetical protein
MIASARLKSSHSEQGLGVGGIQAEPGYDKRNIDVFSF